MVSARIASYMSCPLLCVTASRCGAQATLTSCQPGCAAGRPGTPPPPGPRRGERPHPLTYLAAADRYQPMPYRRCGRSGIKLPEISLGLWQNFGDDRPLDTQRAIILRAFDLGVTHFDLANNYGGHTLDTSDDPVGRLKYGPLYGSAERNFGRILRDDLGRYRDELIISTKAGYDMWPGPYGDWGSRKYLLASLDQSLARMGLDYVDIFYSHRADSDTPLEETMGALATAVTS